MHEDLLLFYYCTRFDVSDAKRIGSHESHNLMQVVFSLLLCSMEEIKSNRVETTNH